MGGWDTMITAETKNILVEAAWFDPAAVRRMQQAATACTPMPRIASSAARTSTRRPSPPPSSRQLILENGGHIEGELVDVAIPAAAGPHRTAPAAHRALPSRSARISRPQPKTAAASEQDTARTSLQRPGLHTLANGAKAATQVTLPSWRLDLEREIDLIEEVARVYGYNRFANTLPSFSGMVVEQPRRPQRGGGAPNCSSPPG